MPVFSLFAKFWIRDGWENVATPTHDCCHNVEVNSSCCHSEVFARGSAIIHDFHSRSVMLPGTIVTSGSLALCLSLPCQLPHLVFSLHAYLKRLEKAVHHGEISAQSLSVIHSRASLFQSPALFGVFRLGATGSTFVSLFPHTLFGPICSFFSHFWKCSRLSSFPVEINRAALGPTGRLSMCLPWCHAGCEP